LSKGTKIHPIYNKELNLILILLSHDISVIWDKRDISYNNDKNDNSNIKDINDIRYIWDISDIRYIWDNQDKSVLMWRSVDP